MNDKLTNWTEFYNQKFKKKNNKDEIENEKMYMKTFDNHYINSKNVLALLLGPSGSGKTTTILEFINRCADNNKEIPFFNIVYFTSSTGDESLIKLLKELIPSTIVIEDVNELPQLNDYKNNNENFNKNLKNMIIFDDIANLNKKQKEALSNWSNSGRKIFSHLFFLCQNPIDVPTTIRRNCNYIFCFKSNELSIIDRLLKKYNIYNLNIEDLKKWYLESSKNKGDFLLLDLTVDSNYKIRHNFKDIFY